MIQIFRVILLSIFIFFSCSDNPEQKDCAGVVGGSNVCGCRDPLALNFDSLATVDGNNCIFPEVVSLWGIDYVVTNTTEIVIEDSSLSGDIPKEIGYLSNLIVLDLSNNQITGNIPSEIGRLVQLTVLDLSSNQISGNIPEDVGNLVELTRLDFTQNSLSGVVPLEICNQGDITPSLMYNKLCPPYPSCINEVFFLAQDTSDCNIIF